jgi:putative FmdB family regulatory protein
MPIYEYRCEQGHTFEVMQRISDDPVSTCTTCEAPVSRVFRPVAVHFKGSGFYNTDYGTRKRQREKEASESSSDSKSSSKNGDSPDKKGSPESKSSDSSGSKPKADKAPSKAAKAD